MLSEAKLRDELLQGYKVHGIVYFFSLMGCNMFLIYGLTPCFILVSQWKELIKFTGLCSSTETKGAYYQIFVVHPNSQSSAPLNMWEQLLCVLQMFIHKSMWKPKSISLCTINIQIKHYNVTEGSDM